MIFIVALTLFPLALYCFALAAVNRRRHPVIVSGTWDFLGTLFGASGFLLFAGPYVLNCLNDRWRDQWLLASADPSADIGDAGHQLWWWIRAGYFMVIVAGAAWLVYRQRRVLSIYNINPAAVPEVIGQILDGLHLSWMWRGNRLLLFDKPSLPAAEGNGTHTAALSSYSGAAGGTQIQEAGTRVAAALASEPVRLLDLDVFQGLHHASIHWATQADRRRVLVEAELRKALADVQTDHNPAAFWFTWFAGGLFAILILMVSVWIGLLILYANRPM
ncbi:MAG TPA: hypothetical protein VFA18_18755 [Gemmataceae bacterium]|nr:hypothetical protein [Gemmataceae bacterium]